MEISDLFSAQRRSLDSVFNYAKNAQEEHENKTAPQFPTPYSQIG